MISNKKLKTNLTAIDEPEINIWSKEEVWRIGGAVEGIEKLDNLLQLECGWTTVDHSGAPCEKRAVELTKVLYNKILNNPDIPIPKMYALESGGVAVIWEKNDIFIIEVEIHNNLNITLRDNGRDPSFPGGLLEFDTKDIEMAVVFLRARFHTIE